MVSLQHRHAGGHESRDAVSHSDAPPLAAAVVVVLLSAWLPESPRYCMVKGQTERADAIIARMYRWNKRPLPCGKLLPLEGAALTHKEAQQQASAGGCCAALQQTVC